MLIKAGVDITRLDRNTRRGLGRTGAVLQGHAQDFIVTSTYEGTHGDGSLHYANQAFDIRKPTDERETILAELKAELGHLFDVVVEVNHWHIEYDPK